MAAPLNNKPKKNKTPNPASMKEQENLPQQPATSQSSNEEPMRLSPQDALLFQQKEAVFDNLWRQIDNLSQGFEKDPEYKAAFGGLCIAAVADAVWELAGRVLVLANPRDKETCLKQYDALSASMRQFVATTYDMEKQDVQQSDTVASQTNG